MTEVMTLKLSRELLMRKRRKILTTLNIRNTTKPERKKKGRIVQSSMMPSIEKMKVRAASIFDFSG